MTLYLTHPESFHTGHQVQQWAVQHRGTHHQDWRRVAAHVHWLTMTAAVRPVLMVRPAVLNCSLLNLVPCEKRCEISELESHSRNGAGSCLEKNTEAIRCSETRNFRAEVENLPNTCNRGRREGRLWRRREVLRRCTGCSPSLRGEVASRRRRTPGPDDEKIQKDPKDPSWLDGQAKRERSFCLAAYSPDIPRACSWTTP